MNARTRLIAMAASGLVLGSAGLAQAGRDSVDAGVRIGGRGGSLDVNVAEHGKHEHVDVRVGVRGDREIRRRGERGRRGHRGDPSYRGDRRRHGPVYDAPRPAARRGHHDHGGYDVAYEIDRAWYLAAAGKPVASARLFNHLMDIRPYDANLKAGYGVVSVMEGRYQRASWAMRRAFMQDLGRLYTIPQTKGVRKRLNNVTRRVRREIDRYGETPDLLFLLASLEVLRGDEYAAMEAGERAKYLGERSPELRRLLRHVRHR